MTPEELAVAMIDHDHPFSTRQAAVPIYDKVVAWPDAASDAPLAEIIRHHPINNSRLAALERYAFVPIHPMCGPRGRANRWGNGVPARDGGAYFITLDAPLGIGLVFEGEPVAVVSGELRNDGDILYTRQIQGVSAYATDEDGWPIFDARGIAQRVGKTRGLGGFWWQAVMLEVMEYAARFIGCSKCVVQSASNNNSAEGDGMLPPKRELEELEKNYDLPALHLGYVLEDDYDFHKDF